MFLLSHHDWVISILKNPLTFTKVIHIYLILYYNSYRHKSYSIIQYILTHCEF